MFGDRPRPVPVAHNVQVVVPPAWTHLRECVCERERERKRERETRGGGTSWHSRVGEGRLGFRVQDSRLGVQGFGFGVRVSGFEIA